MASEAPQPAPVMRGEPVSPKLMRWISLADQLSEKERAEAIKLISERCKKGLAEYGQPLMSEDGRDTIRDAREEAADLLQYIYKACMRGEKKRLIEEVGPLLRLIEALLLSSEGEK